MPVSTAADGLAVASGFTTDAKEALIFATVVPVMPPPSTSVVRFVHSAEEVTSSGSVSSDSWQRRSTSGLPVPAVSEPTAASPRPPPSPPAVRCSCPTLYAGVAHCASVSDVSRLV